MNINIPQHPTRSPNDSLHTVVYPLRGLPPVSLDVNVKAVPAMNLHLGYLPGCIGRIAELHAIYYSRAVGFGAPFEAKVATELAQFCLHYTPARDGLWLAEEDGAIHGSVAIDGSHYPESGAHLRWFIASEHARGKGIGSKMLEAAMAFCEISGYRQVYLWTFDELHAARHLYERHGFRLSRSQRGSQWGKEVNEQLFTRGSVQHG